MYFRPLLLTLTAFALAFNGRAATPARPNIILILADDLGWSDLACYGNTFNETPNIDRLAREGVRFTQFYADPVCSPTRASIQTGQNPARAGITVHIPGLWRPFAKMVEPPVALNLPLEIETFAERLAASGYCTGYFGKWHLGGEGFGPGNHGWQEAIETRGNIVAARVDAKMTGRRNAEFLTEKAVEFITANRDRPFLLQVSHAAVHIPLSTTDELLAKYRAKRPMPNYPSRPEYAGLLEELDRSVGTIVATVDGLGLGSNTLIVFVSDNGGLEHEQDGTVTTSNTPLRSEKGTLYDGGIRVPCLARWSGSIPAGGQSAALASTLDFYPTFVELAGASLPTESVQAIDGISLLPVFRRAAAPFERPALYWHLPHYHHSTPASAVRRGDWKLIEFFEDGALELYNLAADIGEKDNLATRHADRVQSLHALLKAWRKEVQAQLPQRNPAYDSARQAELWSRITVTATRPPCSGRERSEPATGGAGRKGKEKQ